MVWFSDKRELSAGLTFNTGWSSFDEYPRLVASGATIVAFGDSGFCIASFKNNLNETCASPSTGPWQANALAKNSTPTFSSFDRSPRAIRNIDGDGRMVEVVGFGDDNVLIARSNGTGFVVEEVTWIGADPSRKFYTLNSGWTSYNEYPRLLGNVDGKGGVEIVGFGANGVEVAVSVSNGFQAPTVWSNDFTPSSNQTFYSMKEHPRGVADVDGDGKDDLIGIWNCSAYVGLSNGDGFGKMNLWFSGQGMCIKGIVPDLSILAVIFRDVNADGRADVITLSRCRISTYLSDGSMFIKDAGWGMVTEGRNGCDFNSIFELLPTDRNPIAGADINGDYRVDIVVFTDSGVKYVLSEPVFTIDYSLETKGVESDLLNKSDSRAVVSGAIKVAVNIIGPRYGSILRGDNTSNSIFGGDGDDTIEGRGGGDSLDGRGGINTLSYKSSPEGVYVNLELGACDGGDANGDIFTGFTNVEFSPYDDEGYGDDNDNSFTNMGGTDTYTGGGGRNVYRLTNTGEVSRITITDFRCDGEDIIDLREYAHITSVRQLKYATYAEWMYYFIMDNRDWIRVPNNCTLNDELFIFAPKAPTVTSVTNSREKTCTLTEETFPSQEPEPVLSPNSVHVPVPSRVPLAPKLETNPQPALAHQPVATYKPNPVPAESLFVPRAQAVASPIPAPVPLASNIPSNEDSYFQISLGVGLGVGLTLLAGVIGIGACLYVRYKRKTEAPATGVGELPGDLSLHQLPSNALPDRSAAYMTDVSPVKVAPTSPRAPATLSPAAKLAAVPEFPSLEGAGSLLDAAGGRHGLSTPAPPADAPNVMGEAHTAGA